MKQLPPDAVPVTLIKGSLESIKVLQARVQSESPSASWPADLGEPNKRIVPKLAFMLMEPPPKRLQRYEISPGHFHRGTIDHLRHYLRLFTGRDPKDETLKKQDPDLHNVYSTLDWLQWYLTGIADQQKNPLVTPKVDQFATNNGPYYHPNTAYPPYNPYVPYTLYNAHPRGAPYYYSHTYNSPGQSSQHPVGAGAPRPHASENYAAESSQHQRQHLDPKGRRKPSQEQQKPSKWTFADTLGQGPSTRPMEWSVKPK